MKLSQICLLLRLFLFSCRVRQVKFYLAILPLRFFSGIYSERCYSFSCFSLLFPVFYSHIIRLTGPCRVLIQRDDIIFFFSFILWSRMDVRNCTIAAHRSSIPMLLFFFQTGSYCIYTFWTYSHSSDRAQHDNHSATYKTRQKHLDFDDERNTAMRVAHYTVVWDWGELKSSDSRSMPGEGVSTVGSLSTARGACGIQFPYI